VKRSFLALIAWVSSLQSLPARTYQGVPELAKCFQDKGVVGTFALFDVATDRMLVSDEARAKKPFTPASTFKIANSLIGLDVGAVKGVDEVLPYGGKPQRIKEWERDMGHREAIKMSNVPIYQELARRIGIDQMREGVKKLGYGNMEIGSVVDRFGWMARSLSRRSNKRSSFIEC
jgi:beta-lactamase class D